MTLVSLPPVKPEMKVEKLVVIESTSHPKEKTADWLRKRLLFAVLEENSEGVGKRETGIRQDPPRAATRFATTTDQGP